MPNHRLTHVAPKPLTRWRPLVALLVSALVGGALALAVLIVAVVLPRVLPGLPESNDSSGDPLNPTDMVMSLGTLAALLPGVLIGTRIAYGSSGVVLSVAGRMRWGLLGRASLIVLPVYFLFNCVLSLLLDPIQPADLPRLTITGILAFVIAVILSPLQSAAEELVFRGLMLSSRRLPRQPWSRARSRWSPSCSPPCPISSVSRCSGGGSEDARGCVLSNPCAARGRCSSRCAPTAPNWTRWREPALHRPDELLTPR